MAFITLIMLLLTGYLRWLQRRGVAEPDRQCEAKRQSLAARWPRRFPPSFKLPSH